MANKNLTKELIDFTISVPIAGASIGIIQASNLPSSLKTGTSALVGLRLFKGGADLFK